MASARRSGIRRGAGLAGLALAAVLALAGCGSDGGSNGGTAAATGGAGTGGNAAPVTIKIAVQPISDFAPIWLGVSKGIFSDAGLDVQVVPGTASSSAQIPLLSSGQADLAATTATAALQAAAQGIDVKIVGGLTSFGTSADTDPSGVLVKAASGLKSFASLEGKTVAITGLKSVTQAGIMAAVDADGGDANKVKFVQVPMPNIAAAVESGSADAGFVVDPFLGAAKAKGMQVLGQPLSKVAPGTPGTSLVATDKWAKANKATLTKFSTALEKAADYANQHPDEVLAATAEAAKIPLEALKGSKNPVFEATVSPAKLKQEADMLHKYGALDKSVDAESLVWKD